MAVFQDHRLLPAMNSDDWTLKCAERLHRQWPRVDRADLEHLAWALVSEPYWQGMDPGEAAVEWIEQGSLSRGPARNDVAEPDPSALP